MIDLQRDFLMSWVRFQTRNLPTPVEMGRPCQVGERYLHGLNPCPPGLKAFLGRRPKMGVPLKESNFHNTFLRKFDTLPREAEPKTQD